MTLKDAPGAPDSHLSSTEKARIESIPRKRFDERLRPAGCGVNGVREANGRRRADRGLTASASVRRIGRPSSGFGGCVPVHRRSGGSPRYPGPDRGPHRIDRPHLRGGRSRPHLAAATWGPLGHADPFRSAGISHRIDSATRFGAEDSAPLDSPVGSGAPSPPKPLCNPTAKTACKRFRFTGATHAQRDSVAPAR